MRHKIEPLYLLVQVLEIQCNRFSMILSQYFFPFCILCWTWIPVYVQWIPWKFSSMLLELPPKNGSVSVYHTICAKRLILLPLLQRNDILSCRRFAITGMISPLLVCTFLYIRTHFIRTTKLKFASIWRGNSRTGQVTNYWIVVMKALILKSILNA